MYDILGKDKVMTKVSGTITVKGFDGVVEYVAAPLIEKFIVREEDGTEKGVIFTRMKMDRVLNMQVEDTQYTGDIEDFLWLSGMEESDYDKIVYFDRDERARGNQSKPSKREWKSINYNNLALEFGQIEKMLYQTPTYEEASKEKDFSWVDKKDYKVLITKEETDEYIDKISKLPKDTLLGFDTETTGLKADRLKEDEIVGMSLSYEVHTGVYIPIAQKEGKNNEYSADELIEKLQPYIDVESEEKLPLIGHNLGFDWKVLKMHDIELNIVHDTYVMMALIHWAENTFIRGLKPSIEHYFNIDVLDLGEIFAPITKGQLTKIKDIVTTGVRMDSITKNKLKTANTGNDLMDFRYVPEWFYTLYGPADGDFPLWLYQELTQEGGDWEKYKGDLDFTYNLEVSVIPSFSEQEYYGLAFNIDGMGDLEEEAIANRDRIEQEIYKMVGYEFNIASGLQLGKVLFEDMGAPQLDKFRSKKTGAWMTNKDVLNRLGNYRNPDGTKQFPIIDLLGEYSKVNHSITSFFSNLPKLERDGFIFPQYSQLGAATGRVSCKEPNIQQMLPAARANVVPDSDDYYFVISDFSQIERRVMGGMSGDKGMRDRFIEDPEADSHIQTYANMTNTPYEEVTGAQRDIGKTLNFATAYGVQDEKLAMNIYGKDDKYHQSLAADMRRQYFDSVPVFEEYIENKRDVAEVDGYASTYFGRRRYIKEFNYGHTQRYTIEKGRRAAGNMVIQGTAADILKLAMVRLRNAFRRYGFYEDMASIRMNVHDEVTYQIHKSIHPYLAAKIMQEAMEIDLSDYNFPPFYIGMNLGESFFAGQHDYLEAQTLHIHEMAGKATKIIESGEEFPEVEDVNQFWLDDIEDFNLRQIVQELELGILEDNGERTEIKTLEDAHRNPRVIKYAGYFGDIPEPVGIDVMTMEAWVQGSKDALVEDMENIKQGKGKGLLEAMNYVNNNRDIEVTEENIVYLSFFGKGYTFVLDKLKKDENVTVEKVVQEGWDVKAHFSDGEVLTLNRGVDNLHYPKVYRQGEELEEKPLTVQELMKRDIVVEGTTLTFTMEKQDAKLLRILDDIVVPTNFMEDLGIGEEDYLMVMIELPGGTHYKLNGVLATPLNRLFMDLITAYYCEEEYDYEDELARIQDVMIDGE